MKLIDKFRSRIKNWNIPIAFKNKYFFTVFIFITWMTFFDQNNVFLQISRWNELQNAKAQKVFYDDATTYLHEKLDGLVNDKQALEKYAREKYYMKKPNEDVFVIIKE